MPKRLYIEHLYPEQITIIYSVLHDMLISLDVLSNPKHHPLHAEWTVRILKRMTPEMKAMGKVIFVFQKTRNSDGVGTQVHLKWDATHLRIVDEEDGDPAPLTFKKKESDESTNIVDSDKPTGDKLTSLLNSFT